MFGAPKLGRFRSLASLILVVNVVGELQRKRTLAASRCFLAAARLSCSLCQSVGKTDITATESIIITEQGRMAVTEASRACYSYKLHPGHPRGRSIQSIKLIDFASCRRLCVLLLSVHRSCRRRRPESLRCSATLVHRQQSLTDTRLKGSRRHQWHLGHHHHHRHQLDRAAAAAGRGDDDDDDEDTSSQQRSRRPVVGRRRSLVLLETERGRLSRLPPYRRRTTAVDWNNPRPRQSMTRRSGSSSSRTPDDDLRRRESFELGRQIQSA